MDRGASRGALPLRPSAAATVDRLRTLAAFGATPAGIDRRLFSNADRRARAQWAAWARAAGLDVSQDRAGNVFARRAGRRELPPILSGSHLDTVPTGGAYDGAYGAVAALVAMERLAADGVETEHPLEAVAWAGEEGSRFPLGCLGSGVYAGLNALGDVDRLVDADGVSFADARDGVTGLLFDVPVRTQKLHPRAYVELHVEQGPILERAGVRLGNVTGIAGQARYEIVVRGESGHAGTVPMAIRRDALSAAALLVLALEAAARSHEQAVLTVGRFVVEPNQTNVIPAQVTLRVDARSVDPATLAALRVAIEGESARIARERDVAVDATMIETRAPVAMDRELREVLAAAFGQLGEPSIDVPSGAGHDAMCIATIAPAAMIFVPSAGGRSHVDAEYTSPDDLERGVQALARAIVAIDRRLS